jgi:phenylacetate-CoA ligase
VYPSQIEQALLRVPDLEPHYLLVVRRESALDTLEVQVEAGAAAALAGQEGLAAVAAVARRKIAETIGLTADVTVVFPKTIERSVGKARRVLDLRGHS